MTTERTSAETLALYRSNHVITLTGNAYTGGERCMVDGIRVITKRDGKWRHHPDDVLALMDAEYGGSWGFPKVDHKQRAIERIAGLVDVDPDEEPEFDREGQPEFNGSFG